MCKKTNNTKIGFGGGCHWCTEAIFASLKGVHQVEQGWIDSHTPEASTLSEAVIVHFDPSLLTLEILIEIHLLTHNATSNHSLRQKYRSAIYTFDDVQIQEAHRILKTQQASFAKPLITKVYPFKAFKGNEEKFLNYYHKDPQRPFCKRYIEPKLKKLFDDKFVDFRR